MVRVEQLDVGAPSPGGALGDEALHRAGVPEVEGDELVSLSPLGLQFRRRDHGRTFPASTR
ncbi:MAG: hypothetical protein ACRDTR_08290 [Rubrobacter sp.]